MANRYFADTFYWIALTDPRDAAHARVATWLQHHRTARFITTEEVLSEYLTWWSATGIAGRRSAAASVDDILRDTTVQVLAQTRAGFRDALALYQSRLDKEYSLTDCRSMVAMKSLGLSDVLTNDHHFSQEGFTVVFA